MKYSAPKNDFFYDIVPPGTRQCWNTWTTCRDTGARFWELHDVARAIDDGTCRLISGRAGRRIMARTPRNAAVQINSANSDSGAKSSTSNRSSDRYDSHVLKLRATPADWVHSACAKRSVDIQSIGAVEFYW